MLLTKPEDPPTPWARLLSKVELVRSARDPCWRKFSCSLRSWQGSGGWVAVSLSVLANIGKQEVVSAVSVW
jgi:hypothetical protein